jgi:hypothetical protein
MWDKEVIINYDDYLPLAEIPGTAKVPKTLLIISSGLPGPVTNVIN